MPDFLSMLSGTVEGTYLEKVSMDDIKIGYYFTYAEDGTFSMYLGQEDVTEFYRVMRERLEKAWFDYVYEATEQELLLQGITMEEAMAIMGYDSFEAVVEDTYGMSMDEIYETMFGMLTSPEYIEMVCSSVQQAGVYKIESGQIETTFAGETGVVEYRFADDDTLILMSSAGAQDEAIPDDASAYEAGFYTFAEELYPMTLTRVK